MCDRPALWAAFAALLRRTRQAANSLRRLATGLVADFSRAFALSQRAQARPRPRNVAPARRAVVSGQAKSAARCHPPLRDRNAAVCCYRPVGPARGCQARGRRRQRRSNSADFPSAQAPRRPRSPRFFGPSPSGNAARRSGRSNRSSRASPEGGRR